MNPPHEMPSGKEPVDAGSSSSHTVLFPATDSTWKAHEPIPLYYKILDQLGRTFDLDIPVPQQAKLVEHESDDMNAFLAYEAVTYCTKESPSQDMSLMAVLTFPRLQHLNLHGFEIELESELHELCSTETTNKEQLGRLRVLLHDYAQAIRDYEYVSKNAVTVKPMSPNYLFPYHEALLPTLHARLTSPHDSPTYRTSWTDNTYRQISTSYSGWADTILNKTFAALFGGLVLVVPMLVMTLVQPGVRTSLITSSISIFIVALSIAKFANGTWRDVVGMTAAYASVLVVFVGTSLNSGNSGGGAGGAGG